MRVNCDLKEYYGRVIQDAKIENEKLVLKFDEVLLEIYDNGQDCCEYRYMSCDDDVSSIIGEKLRNIELKEVKDDEDGCDCHEIAFVEVATDKDFITLQNHNEHNGYYGGFGLEVKEETPATRVECLERTIEILELKYNFTNLSFDELTSKKYDKQLKEYDEHKKEIKKLKDEYPEYFI